MPGRLDQMVQMIRAHLRDFPELNRLVDGLESGNSTIATAVLDALDDFNLTSPLAPISMDTFPSPSLLRTGAMKFLLESIALLQARNQLTYSDGQGVQVSTSDKAPLYLNMVQKLTQEWETKKTQLIVRLNIRGMMGSGVFSDFRQLDEDRGGK